VLERRKAVRSAAEILAMRICRKLGVTPNSCSISKTSRWWTGRHTVYECLNDYRCSYVLACTEGVDGGTLSIRTSYGNGKTVVVHSFLSCQSVVFTGNVFRNGKLCKELRLEESCLALSSRAWLDVVDELVDLYFMLSR
jgi:hypothetical protein